MTEKIRADIYKYLAKSWEKEYVKLKAENIELRRELEEYKLMNRIGKIRKECESGNNPLIGKET